MLDLGYLNGTAPGAEKSALATHSNELMARSAIDASQSPLASKVTGPRNGTGIAFSGVDFLHVGSTSDGINKIPKDKAQVSESSADANCYAMDLDGGGATGRIPGLYVADYQRSKIWLLPLDQGIEAAPRSITTVRDVCGISVTADGRNAAVTNRSGELYWVDLETGYTGFPIATGLGSWCRVALDETGNGTAYVSDSSGGVLWKVPMAGGDKAVVATGMSLPQNVFLRHNSGPGNAFTYAYIVTASGDMWRIPVGGAPVAGDGLSGYQVSRDRDLAVFNLGNAGAVTIDAEGVAYIASDGMVWTVKEVDDPLPENGATGEFSVSSSGDTTISQGGGPGYSGVALQNTSTAPVSPRDVTVTLRSDRGLRFEKPGGTDFLLTVMGSNGTLENYAGTTSTNEQTVTFRQVDLALPTAGSTSAAWVVVAASPRAPVGMTDLNFSVGEQRSPSGAIHVVSGQGLFDVSPSGPPNVVLTRGHGAGYPGVTLRGQGTEPIPPQDITVTLPPGMGLRFVPEGNPSYVLTVKSGDHSTFHAGMLGHDGQTLTFPQVELGILGQGSESRAWLAAAALSDAPFGVTSLSFTVGSRSSLSTPVQVA